MPAPRQLNTHAVVLRRVNYGEADRILTLLTPDYGKLSAIAKGARKPKSKMAGGIELFSISEISFIKGKNDIDTLTSTRLQKHFGSIVKDLARSAAAYNFIKLIDKNTEEHPEGAYFDLLADGLAVLDDNSLNLELAQLWFSAQLLKLAGHSPNLKTDTADAKLEAQQKYDFDYERMAFAAGTAFSANQIKVLRLLFGASQPKTLANINDIEKLSAKVQPLITACSNAYLRF